VNAEEKMLEKGRHPELNRVEWVPNSMSNISTNDKNNTITFHRLLELIPPSDKTLKEARGYVVADYQDHLEREWIKELRKDYDVKINDKVYENLIKE
jgi:peptidyl-prolyl cis-trans isomerase SurA